MSFLDRFFKSSRPTLSEVASGNMDVEEFKKVVGDALIHDLIDERQTERRWRHIKRIVVSGGGLILFAIYVGFYVTSLGYRIVPNSDIVGVVHVSGGIDSSSETASASAVIPALQKAFSKPNVKAIVLAIDSPGGAPGEAERIYTYIESEKLKTHKEVIAIIENTGASAAYMIALHADKIYSGKYSLVGSIGAKMETWNFARIAEKLEVDRKVYASGQLKGMLDPFSPGSSQADAKAMDIVTRGGQRFAKEVTDIRGKKMLPGVNYFTGEVWVGEQAKELGLVDEIGTLEGVVQSKWALSTYDFGPEPKKSHLPFGLSSVVDDLVTDIANHIVSAFASRSPLQ